MRKNDKQNKLEIYDLEGREDEKLITFSVRLPAKMVECLDKYRESQRFPPSRQIIIEKLLADFLRSTNTNGV